MIEDRKIDTEFGQVSYSLHICDNCGKKSISPNWLRLESFFRDFEWLFERNIFNENFYKIACSTYCLEILFRDSFRKFYEAWNIRERNARKHQKKTTKFKAKLINHIQEKRES